MREVETGLKTLNKHDQAEILQDFEEHFSNGLSEGKTEYQISAALGSPRHIAKEILAEFHMEKVKHNTSAGNMMRAVWAVFGLSMFNLIIVLGPFVALVG
ncbi:DUF1700 domain-containing protein [Lentibacillus sp. JNUCC-1]|uniref:DUF1700 domain-containing protein n=1 Tax=Lentibacillus sp. JNUCC-1 TaxID=2654513 RepID=UPI001E322D89|nr:DUF1700 domain-containing protein [Lentibacillus sp. JNUCC-1]